MNTKKPLFTFTLLEKLDERRSMFVGADKPADEIYKLAKSHRPKEFGLRPPEVATLSWLYECLVEENCGECFAEWVSEQELDELKMALAMGSLVDLGWVVIVGKPEVLN